MATTHVLDLSNPYFENYKQILSPERYNKIICDQLEAGIIERVPETSDSSNEKTRINFLPHHPVIRRDKDTTKVRVVYDGSANGSNDERSLNETAWQYTVPG
ncbi:Hypothetical predicted protein [Paramuricea clavata]|uniref:Uncharacterized protein n=1 Tax=Paramuricea clavata TaxID=317549 RepID=A0A7D9LLE7_PARCT|nr:Hypothetical predicted protein [Paramuricea clavata]